MNGTVAPSDIVVDSTTGLIWSRKDNGQRLNWHEAKRRAQELTLGGYTDWRLPALEELHGLWDPPARNIRKPFELSRPWVWSATQDGPDYAWCFYYAIGMSLRYPLRVSYDVRALFVREP